MKNDARPLISVVIPVFNGEKTLIDTLESVLKQTYNNFEIIIVDDGSDHPVESFLKPVLDDTRIRAYRTGRSNANVARNYGIRKSKGEYIAMLDADDCWLDNHLQDCLALLQESNVAGLYGSLFLRRSLSGAIHELPVFFARELKEGESMIDYLLTIGYGAQTSTLFTTARAMKDILWNPELIDHQDYDFVVRFSKKYTMTVKKDPSVVYFLASGRAPHYETCIRFVEDNINDIDPEIYMRYNLKMYLRATQKEESKKFASYFQKEAARYRECFPNQRLVSTRNPQIRIRKSDKYSNENINLSVVIPVYNVENYLPACLDSLMQQGELRLEIILVDDGSTDRSGAVAVRYARQDPRIKVIHQENRGASAARNAGLEMAQGEYIVFLDSDDWVRENSLCELYHEAVKHRADVVMGNTLFCYPDGKIAGPLLTGEIINKTFSGKEGFIALVKNGIYLPMPFQYLCRRSYLQKIQVRFEEGVMHEDELWTPVVLYQAGTMVVTGIDYYYYRQREESVMHSANLIKRLDSLFLITGRLIELAGRFDFSGENGELKNWMYVNIFKLYTRPFLFLSRIKDSSYAVPDHHLDRFWRDCREMAPESQKICKRYFDNAVAGLQKYTGWRTSEWVASVDFQIKAGKKLMLVYNTIRGEDLSLKINDVPEEWVITTDRRYFQQADAVVFYLPDLSQELEYDLDKPEGQVWVSWQLESENVDQWMKDTEINECFDYWMTCPEDMKTQKEHPVVSLCRRYQ